MVTKEISVLIVDDDSGVAASIRLELKENYTVNSASTIDEAREKITQIKPNIVILDVHLSTSEPDGLEFLNEIKRINKQIQVIMLTAERNSTTIIEAIKRGASDYITKPFERNDLLRTVEKASYRFLSEKPNTSAVYENIENMPTEYIGRSNASQKLREMAEKMAKHHVNVLIIGESGTGKEVLARQIHSIKKDSSRPFVAINCAAIPSELMESILFGHEKGSFTGAVNQKIGKFEQANGGDIFLDEIGSMPLALQAKLLRVIQEHEFERVGGTQTLRSDFRVIAATNRDLRKQIEEGTFREDLYYRLSVVQLNILPLRERREDINQLVDYFINKSRNNGFQKRMLSETRAKLASLDWPGNARQLANVIESMLVISDNKELRVEDIPEQAYNRIQNGNASFQLSEFEKAMDAYESDWIQKAINQAYGEKQGASKLLNISRSSLIRRMKRLEMMK
jgi:two-component system response regulator AtoC